MKKRQINFGIIGGGLMGREFASAAARWFHLLDLDVIPRVVAICDTNPAMLRWFTEHVDTIQVATHDYNMLLTNPGIDAIYCAVPHHLHEELYCAIIKAGKHLLGEKPFGIDAPANARILEVIQQHPDVLVRCSSEFPFFPGAQKLWQFLREERFGTILEVQAGFLHSSDLDPRKPINWKRQVSTNGAYGCMGDLGMHVLHIPLRAGWFPQNVRAFLANIVTERPDAHGVMQPCDTWDNALLACEVSSHSQHFPLLLETKRMAPGETNTWYLRILGTAFSAEFSTKYPKTLRTLPYTPDQPQAWQSQDLGYETAYPTLTGAIFEFGFSDSLLQMWAAFCDELASFNPDTPLYFRRPVHQPFTCVTPEETRQSHALLTAALESQRLGQVVQLEWEGQS